MVSKYIKVLARLISVGLLALFLILFTPSPMLAQITGLGLSEDNLSSQSYVPVFTQGNLDIAPVFLDGKLIGTVSSFIELAPDEDSNQPSSYDAPTRSHLMNSKLQKILDNMSRYSQVLLPKHGISGVEKQEQELRKQLITSFSEKKGNAVVSVTFPQDDVPEIIYSITQADISIARFGNSQPLKIAQVASRSIENALIQAWKERQKPYLLTQAQRALLVLLALTCASLTLWWVQKLFVARQRKLEESLLNSKTVQHQHNWISGLSKVTGKFTQQFQKLRLSQRHSLNAFCRSGLFWTQWLLWMSGIGYLTSLFYWTRPLSNWIVGVTISNIGVGSQTGEIIYSWPPINWFLSFGQKATLGTPLLILILFLGTRLIIKGGDVLSDFFANNWIKEQSIQRHNLRAPTLTRAFKGLLRVVVYLFLGVTIIYHLHQLGTITQVVAVFLGFFSFALSLASQDLLRDLIAGLLILWEDQYAVGDVIVIGDQGGLVENITLRLTQLRNLDGELINIPNRSIEMVRNLSSDWSQVNYAIEISYDADVDLALKVIETVAQKLYQDSQWQERILEAPEVLGIDNISHTGILIRVIIKTKPLEQWSVAREFRFRLKKAFDREGIELGIPQQTMHINTPFPKTSNGNFKTHDQDNQF